MIVHRPLAPLAVALLLLAGCGDENVKTYQVPHEKDPEMPGAPAAAPAAPAAQPAMPADNNAMASTAVPVAEGPGLVWAAPARWTAKPASAMRKGSYSVPGDGGAEGDLSISAFPGDVGGELANVNRWRGQVGLPPLAEGDLGGSVSRSSHDGLQLTVVDCAASGAQAQRILGAIVPYGDGTWFFKLMGPASTIEKAKPEFIAFLQTVKPSKP